MRSLLIGLPIFAYLLAFHASGENLYERTPNRPRAESLALDEASGLAASSRNDRYLWSLNDSGGTNHLHLLDAEGKDHGKIELKGSTNIDWEDIDSFTYRGKPYLLVADVGDNAEARETCALYIVPEPPLPAEGKRLSGAVTPAWKIVFRYEDGPRDCESVAVHPQSGKILLLSKRAKPPALYQLPLASPGNKVPTATLVAHTPAGSFPGSILPFSNQPTGMAINTAGTLAAAVTYHRVVLFPRQPNESWAVAFSRKPILLKPHSLPQAESITFSKDGKTLTLISEGKQARLASYQMIEANP